MAVLGNVFDELLVFLGRPEAFSQLLLITTRMPAHLESNYSALLPKAPTKPLPNKLVIPREKRERKRVRENERAIGNQVNRGEL